jgi:hypothetical protein
MQKNTKVSILLTPWRQNPQFHHCIYKILTPAPILSQLDVLYTPPAIIPEIPSSRLRLGLPSGLFPSSFPNKTLYSFLSCLMLAACSAHLIALDLICLTIFGEEYELWSSSLWSFQVLTAAGMKFRFFWDVAPCSRIGVDQRFRGAYCTPMRLHGATSHKTLNFILTIELAYSLLFWKQIGL